MDGRTFAVKGRYGAGMAHLLRMSSWCGAIVAIGLAGPARGAEERIPLPPGAFVCTSIETVIEHARIVRLPTSEGIRPFVEAQVASGACRVIQPETTIVVVDVDKRGFAQVDDGKSGPEWTDAENVWGYFDAPAKVEGWKKP